MRTMLLLVILAMVATGVSCSHTENGAEVSVADATAMLDKVVACAQAHDLKGLGKLADDLPITQTNWDSAGGWATLPAEPPTIVGSRLLPTTPWGDGYIALGGRVLTLEGIDGTGKPYHSEVLVFYEDGKLKMINTIYWDNTTIGHPE
jgi:hypothetical protein